MPPKFILKQQSSLTVLDVKSLRIFPDNVMDISTANADDDPSGLRPYNQFGNCKNHPLTAGIPVAWSPWKPVDPFEELEPQVIAHIDQALVEIKRLINTYHYSGLVVAVDSLDNPKFSPDCEDEVSKYILKKLKLLCESR